MYSLFFLLFIFSIREYSCNVSQTYLKFQKKNDCCIIFYCIFTLGNNVFLHFSQKNSKILGGFAPWTPPRALPWTHWGAHSTPQTPSWCFTCLQHVPFLLCKKPMHPCFFCIIPWYVRVSHRCCKHGGTVPPCTLGLSQSIGGTWGELKMLSKNTCEGVHLIVKLPAISLQASKFPKTELLHSYF